MTIAELPERCANCGETGIGPYCHRCGQERDVSLSVRSIVHETLEHALHLDVRWLHTFIGLFRDPGGTIRRYVGGERGKLSNPVYYLLIAATLYAVVINVFHIDPRGPMARFARFPDEHARRAFETVVEVWLHYLWVVPLALVAAVHWRLFRRSGDTLAAKYVFNLFVAGHFFIFECLIAPLLGAAGLVGTWFYPALLYLPKLAYYSLSLRAFEGAGWLRAGGVAAILILMQAVFQSALLSAAFIALAQR